MQAFTHTRSQQSLNDGNFGKGGEVHESPREAGQEIRHQRIASYSPLYTAVRNYTGMAVSPWVEPNRKPGVTTPMANNGKICLAKPQEAQSHSLVLFVTFVENRVADSAEIATTIGTSGTSFASVTNRFARIAETTVAIARVKPTKRAV